MENNAPHQSDVPAAASAATGAGSAAAPVVQSVAAGLSFGNTLALCAMTGLVTLAAALFAPVVAERHGFELPGRQDKVVFVDFERLIKAGMDRTINSGYSDVKDVQKEAEQFQSDVSARIAMYAQEGYIVINSKALIDGSKTKDVTGDILVSMGFK